MSIHPQSLAKVTGVDVRCSIPILTTCIAPPFPHPGAPQPTIMGKPKRKQVKMAVCPPSRFHYLVLLSHLICVQCTNCASACKKCDDGRPCQRCMRSNLTSTCKDGVRKERKRGIKRGPYKRRNKPPSDDEAEVPRGQFHHFPSLRSQLTRTPLEPAPPMSNTIPEGYFPYFMPPPGYFQGADGQNGAPPVQVPFYSYHQLAPFPYPTGIPMPFMQPIPGQPGPSHHPIEPLQPLGVKGKRQRSSTDELSTPKKAKSDDQQTNSTPDAEGGDSSPPATDSTSQPSKPPSIEQ